MTKIAIGCDHAGYSLKKHIVSVLTSKGIDIIDYGTQTEERVDYPDFAHAVSKAVENDDETLGILICGSGNGIAMTANKHQGIRAALCWIPEIATLARQHNNANILVMPGRFISNEEGTAVLNAFLDASFEGGRHGIRVDKIPTGC